MKKMTLIFIALVALLLVGCGEEITTEVAVEETVAESDTTVTVETPVDESSATTEETTEETSETETVAEETAETTSAYEGGSQAGCEDTDGGKNYELYGTIVDVHGTTDYDRCSENEYSLQRLYESFCGEDGKRARETYDCPSGSCKAGACVAAEEIAE